MAYPPRMCATCHCKINGGEPDVRIMQVVPSMVTSFHRTLTALNHLRWHVECFERDVEPALIKVYGDGGVVYA